MSLLFNLSEWKWPFRETLKYETVYRKRDEILSELYDHISDRILAICKNENYDKLSVVINTVREDPEMDMYVKVRFISSLYSLISYSYDKKIRNRKKMPKEKMGSDSI